MISLIPLLDASVSMDRLSHGLLAHLAASGMPLPEDECVLDHLASAAKFGRTRAVLAVADGEAIGVAAWRVEGRSGVIILIYVLPDVPPATAIDLLRTAVQNLQQGAIGDGIFAEVPDVSPALAGAFATMGFVGVERHLLRVELGEQHRAVAVPPGYRLREWHDDDLTAAVDVIYRANIGTLDAQIIPELRTPDSTRQIIEQTVQGRYGTFDRGASGLILTEDGQACGVTLATRRRSGQGFTAEICVLPEHRRRGLARSLMVHTHAAFLHRELTQNTLGVTAGNPARRLYEELGYRRIGSVWTFVWPRPAGWLGE
jgi:GNAT superfamily N-acetyltransferase